MKRMMPLLLALTIPILLFSNIRPAAAAWLEYVYDFNTTLKPFQVIANDPVNIDEKTLTLSHSCLNGRSRDNGCALLTDAHAAGFIGLMTQLQGEGTAIRIEFIARDMDNCGWCGVLVYTGNGKPLGLGSFQLIGPILSKEWRTYRYQAWLDGSNPVVAIAIENLGGSMEPKQADIDNVRVTFLDD